MRFASSLSLTTEDSEESEDSEDSEESEVSEVSEFSEDSEVSEFSIFNSSQLPAQLITPSVPAMAVSTAMRSLRNSFQLIFMVFGVKG